LRFVKGEGFGSGIFIAHLQGGNAPHCLPWNRQTIKKLSNVPLPGHAENSRGFLF